MKNALLIGCGSKWGADFTRYLLTKNYHIDLITSSDNFSGTPNVNPHKVDWQQYTGPVVDTISENLSQKTYDLIFFNQNGGGGPNNEWFRPNCMFSEDSWADILKRDSMMSYRLVHKLTNSINKSTKVGWMLTGLIDGKDPNHWGYAGYGSMKSMHLFIMRGFASAHPGIFFAINPIWFPKGDEVKDAEAILNVIEKLEPKDNGKTFNKDGSTWI